MTIIHFYHDLHKTPTEMSFCVCRVQSSYTKKLCQAYLEQESDDIKRLRISAAQKLIKLSF